MREPADDRGGIVDEGVRAPFLRSIGLAEIAEGRGEGVHAGGAARADVALGVADVVALRRRAAREAAGVKQRIGMRFAIGGRVAAYDTGGARGEAERSHARIG